ncbi:hypothetical protein HY485_01705 [Candidatus Woesearchaeota archaeon]|nr:hypothetical protein [Candidatus Woesearchaeota archaeon]
MGKEKYLRKINELFVRSPVVTMSSIQKYIKNKQYAKQFVHILLMNGKIKKLTKGAYTIHDAPQLIIFCFKPAYFGLQDALSYHDLWEQETIPVIVTARKTRTGLRKILGANVLIRRIDKKHFFGYDYVKQGEFYVPYSDIEKTLTDMIYFKEGLNNNVVKNIVESIDKKKLEKYLSGYKPAFRKKVKKIIGW